MRFTIAPLLRRHGDRGLVPAMPRACTVFPTRASGRVPQPRPPRRRPASPPSASPGAMCSGTHARPTRGPISDPATAGVRNSRPLNPGVRLGYRDESGQHHRADVQPTPHGAHRRARNPGLAFRSRAPRAAPKASSACPRRRTAGCCRFARVDPAGCGTIEVGRRRARSRVNRA